MRKVAKLFGLTAALACAHVVAADGSSDVAAMAPATAQVGTTPAVDNTKINARDKVGALLTPQNQSNRTGDRELLAAVRRAVSGDKTLSTSAHNIKIVATDGTVTLRGPVRSAEEKDKVEKLALQVAGVASVQNQLDIKAQ